MAIIGTLPNVIANGQLEDADPVMADFQFIVSEVNANAASNQVANVVAEREAVVALSNTNAANVLNWNRGGTATLTVTGTSATISFTNLPNGVAGWMTLKIVNGGLCSGGVLSGLIPVPTLLTPGGAAVTLTVAGNDRISLYCDDGATVEVLGTALDVK